MSDFQPETPNNHLNFPTRSLPHRRLSVVVLSIIAANSFQSLEHYY